MTNFSSQAATSVVTSWFSPYHSFHFSVNVRCISGVRPAGTTSICQLLHSTFKRPILILYLPKLHTQCPLHSVTNISSFLTLCSPRNEKPVRFYSLVHAFKGDAILSLVCWRFKLRNGQRSSIPMHLKRNRVTESVLQVSATWFRIFEAKLRLPFDSPSWIPCAIRLSPDHSKC